MLVDVLVGVVLLGGLIAGLRRGFFKEAVAVLALILATSAAIHAYGPWGPVVAEKIGVPADVGYLLLGTGVWIAVYLLVVILGRIVYKGLRGDGPLSKAEDVADAVVGRSKTGPVTMILRPLPKPSDIFYWVDKALGAGLGVAQALLIILLIMLAAMAFPGPLGKMGEAIRKSGSYALYKRDVDPKLAQVPAVQIVRGLGEMAGVLESVKKDPQRLDRLKAHPSIDAVKSHPLVKEIAEDEALRKAIKDKHFHEALHHPKVIALLKDEEFRRRVASIDWAAIRAELEADPAAAKK